MPRAAAPTLGTLVVVTIVVIGLLAAAFGWWYAAEVQRRALPYWGGEAAALILHGDEVELLKLGPASAAAGAEETFDVANQALAVRREIDISKAPGLAHVRHSLVNDATFDWHAPPPSAPPDYGYALRFRGEQGEVTVLFDLTAGWAVALEGEPPVSIRPVTGPQQGDPNQPLLQSIFQDYERRADEEKLPST